VLVDVAVDEECVVGMDVVVDAVVVEAVIEEDAVVLLLEDDACIDAILARRICTCCMSSAISC
jgi:hypothetical protein